MEVPKNLRYALEHRCSYAYALMKYDTEVCRWLRANGITVDEKDINLGEEVIFNPLDSMKRILEAIEKAQPSASKSTE